MGRLKNHCGMSLKKKEKSYRALLKSNNQN
jgi:hypothetical protein